MARSTHLAPKIKPAVGAGFGDEVSWRRQLMTSPRNDFTAPAPRRKEKVEKTFFDTDFFKDEKIQYLIAEYGNDGPTWYLRIALAILSEGGELHGKMARAFLKQLQATPEAAERFLADCVEIGLFYLAGDVIRSYRADREVELLTTKRDSWRSRQRKSRDLHGCHTGVTRDSRVSHRDSEKEQEKEQEPEVDRETGEVQEGGRPLPPPYHDDPATWDPLRREAEDALEPLTPEIARAGGFISLMRRPMKKYPTIWLTGVELANVSEQLIEVGLGRHRRDVFLKADAQAKRERLRVPNKDPSLIDTYSWLINFCKQRVLDEQAAVTKLDTNKAYNQQARGK